MRRWFAVLLLVFLPLQTIWAAAAPYCGHEEELAAWDVGHHTHEHRDAQPSGDEGSDGLPSSHADCHVCHGAGGAVGTPQDDASHSGAYRGHPPMRVRALPAPPVFTPDRPNWARLASTARRRMPVAEQRC